MQQQSSKMATSLSQPPPPSNNKNSGDAVAALMPDVENFLADLQGRSAITGTVLIKQASLLEKIRAINSDGQTSAATNHNHSNGQVTPPSSHERKGSASSGEVTYDDTMVVGSRPPPLSTPTSPAPSSASYVIKSDEPVEYEDVAAEKNKKKPKTSSSSSAGAAKATSDTMSAEKAAADATHSGYLVKKTKSLLAKLTNARKWCVLTRQDTFYCFEKNTSKTPVESIPVKEFQCVPASGELSKKQDFTFTLSNAKKTHTFAASSTEDFEAWMVALNKMCVTGPTSSSAIGSAAAKPAFKPSAGDYEDANNLNSVDLDEDLYSSVPDEMVQPAAKTSVTSSQPANKNSQAPEKPKGALPERTKGGLPPVPVTAPPHLPTPNDDDDEMVYDDTEALPSPAKQAQQSSVTSVKPKVSDYEYEEDEQVYDDTVSPASQSLPPPPQSAMHPASPPAVPNSSPPQPQLRKNPGLTKGIAICHSIDASDDNFSDPMYPPLPPRQFSGDKNDGEDLKNIVSDLSPSCLFVAKWDWTQDEGHQLTFRRGQLLQVVSKQHEQHGWWIMTDGHVSGMVPCSYVTTALTAV